MTLADAVAFLRPALQEQRSGTWCDLGAGHGLFTEALAEILGPAAIIIAVDRDPAAVEGLARLAQQRRGNGTIQVVSRDLREFCSDAVQRDVMLDGALFANSLHYITDPAVVLHDIARGMSAGGRIVVVEYERHTANRWVPQPLPVRALETAAHDAGLSRPTVVARRASAFQGQMYCAWLERPADVP